MIRVIYLVNQKDLKLRNSLIQRTLQCEKWSFINNKGKKQYIQDKDMVDFANKLNGWTQNVYKFGCAFIHLSNYHDYQTEDPFQSLTDEDKDSIIAQMKHYHYANLNKSPAFEDLIPYLQSVMDKISSNYECEIKTLEERRIKKN